MAIMRFYSQDQFNKIHSIERAKERYKLVLEKWEWKAITERIEYGNQLTKFLYDIEVNKAIYAIYYRERWLCVLYNRVSKQVLTILPKRILTNVEFYKEQYKNMVENG